MAIGVGRGRDLQRQRVARAVRIVDLAILGLSLAFVGALLSLWGPRERRVIECRLLPGFGTASNRAGGSKWSGWLLRGVYA